MSIETAPPGYSHTPVRAIGNNLSLDFINTADWNGAGEVIHEKLAAPDDIEIWLDKLGIRGLASPLGNLSLEELRAYRRDMREVVLSLYRGHAPKPERLQQVLSPMCDGPSLVPQASGIGYAPTATLQQLVAMHAASMFSAPATRKQLKMCRGDDCGWFFLDQSKTGRRVWCCMETCGNRAKARRFSARAKEKEKRAAI
ncbi:CGNR zinc finger domain-containing protein [Thalassococcus sp. BH17M4-6]|uniref:CGNR zinc finger domain-containing protein n=1 Tax=Thalassococcus sp. BH17M4-6 TaxID=3413148 RepID=UPI003BE9287B